MFTKRRRERKAQAAAEEQLRIAQQQEADEKDAAKAAHLHELQLSLANLLTENAEIENERNSLDEELVAVRSSLGARLRSLEKETIDLKHKARATETSQAELQHELRVVVEEQETSEQNWRAKFSEMESSLRLEREQTDKKCREKEQLQRALDSAEAQLKATILISVEEKNAAEGIIAKLTDETFQQQNLTEGIIANLEEEKSQLLEMQATLMAEREVERDQEQHNATRAQQNIQETEEKLSAATRTFELQIEEKLLEKNALLNQVRASEVEIQSAEKKWRTQLEELKQDMQRVQEQARAHQEEACAHQEEARALQVQCSECNNDQGRLRKELETKVSELAMMAAAIEEKEKEKEKGKEKGKEKEKEKERERGKEKERKRGR